MNIMNSSLHSSLDQQINGGDDSSKCLVCNGDYHASKLPGLHQCRSCGFISANLNIPEEELNKLYGIDYFHGNEYLDYLAEEESLKINFRRRILTLKQLIPGIADQELFEIGCAYGFFLEEVGNHVRSAQGMDISTEAVKHASQIKGLSAVPGNYLTADLGKKFDIITMWDTVEHLNRPDQFIRKAAHDLKPGGHIALTTGDIGSLNARMRGPKWRMIHPPTHLHYFSVPTLSRLLERYGFSVVHVSHPGNSRNIRSILHFILDLRLKRRKIYDRIADWKLFDLSITANLYDIMFIIARNK